MEGEEPSPADAPPVIVGQTPHQTLYVCRSETVMDVVMERTNAEFLEVISGKENNREKEKEAKILN